jgi:nitrogen fixation-related uncharacterized protein
MNLLILTITLFLGFIGIGVFIWSIYDTRNKYYNEYIKKKSHES